MVEVLFPILRHLFILSLIIGTPHFAGAAGSDCDPWAAKAVSVQGTVESRSDGGLWQPVNLDDTFCPGDEIRVLENSRASLSLINESVLRLNANSAVVVQEFKNQKTSLIDMFKGAAHFLSRRPTSFEVRTPYVVAGVRGTEFLIRVEDDQTFLSIFEGAVLASNDAGEVTLATGQSAIAQQGKAPVLTTVVRPRDAVQWALYYPPLAYMPPEKAMAEDLDDPAFLADRSARLLSVGRIDEAEADLRKAMAIAPRFADALSLQSIVALVKNDKDNAYNLASQAVEADPRSPSAHIARSYAQQALFDLEGARRSLTDAVAASPDDALAHARLAEIQLSFGELDKALQSARKAAALAPDLSRTQTVLGFAYLTQVKTDDARAAFQKAIRADQADPLPRLGMGLAKIRDGDLEAGRTELEVAASLDPNNSLIRSYLGKAFYEEKRTGLDEREYQIAKELDPNDPTPYFYDAIAKQTTNRPVEALQDLQKAIELNGNRSVYRSKLLLDSDLAARSASQARIYSDLGFQQRALAEGYYAVNVDPTNYSAHRFLADSYSVLPRHEIARVSELLQSQLLQPSNMTPIQPGLAESNLFLISAGGAANTSFNEFNPLFNRNGATLQASGIIGENDTWGGEGVVAGIYDKLSMSAGYTQFETDGFRANNDQEDKIANIFAQYEITHQTSIQAEYRYRKVDKGDVELLFWEDNIAEDLRQRDRRHNYRLGFRHAFTPGSIFIGNFSYNKTDGETDDVFHIDGAPDFPPPPIQDIFKADINEDAYTGELQHLFRTSHFSTVAGAGYFDIDQKIRIAEEVSWPGTDPPFFLGSFQDDIQNDIRHSNLYLYTYLNFLSNLTFTVGASGDFFEVDEEGEGGQDLEEKQVNPKFGLTWRPLEGTTVRGAVFRTLKRTLVTDQTLEPTQVSGFNQFYDDPNATRSWIYGAAVDQKFTRFVYGGFQFTYRDLEVPWYGQVSPIDPLQFNEADWDEYSGRMYAYWAPHPWWALRAEYGYEKIERAQEFSEGIREAKTHKVPLGINFFHPSGFSSALVATYYNQEGEFIRKDTLTFETGDDSFWLFDAMLSYRLPKRYGLLTLGATNLLDRNFNYADTDINNPKVQSGRTLFAKVTIALP